MTDGVVPPRLHIFESCFNLINEMVRATTNEKDVEDMDPDAPDHAIDCLRYLLMYLNKAYIAEKIQEIPYNTWQAVFDDYEAPDDRPRYARGNAA